MHTKRIYTKVRLLNEGKTKRVHAVKEDMSIAIIESKDDITAEDGAKRDVIEGKGAFATTTTCNVFRLLNDCGVRTAFRGQISATEFIAERCDMIDIEVVVRREGHGSHLKRNPQDKKGVLFPKLRVEFYLKTSGKKVGNLDIPVDDPLIEFVHQYETVVGMNLYRPDKPIAGQKTFLSFEEFPFKWDQKLLTEMDDMARNVFLILERAWWLEEFRLVDFKIEFGLNIDGQLVLADVIDNDSWRLVRSGLYQDKQVYRDGGDLNEVTRKYKAVAIATEHFGLPRQRILLWTGSDKDDTTPLIDAHERFAHVQDCELRYHVRSMHKQPVQGIHDLHKWVQGTFDVDEGCVNTVIIAYIGMSNGAGPTLSANTHVPVITCSSSVKDFPDDIWSSLRTPSYVPVMTVLSEKNALLAAIEILAIRSPRLFALLRRKVEDRM